MYHQSPLHPSSILGFVRSKSKPFALSNTELPREMDALNIERSSPILENSNFAKPPGYSAVETDEESGQFKSSRLEDPMLPHAKPMFQDHGATDSGPTDDCLLAPYNDQEFWWKATHACGFFVGGTTFIAGTACYFYPAWEAGALVAGILYTVGSCGFLYVDVLEYFTYTDEPWLRTNISCSAIGSLLYVIGSIGYIPAVYAMTALIGEYGFIFGSLFIGCSQTWKVCRLSLVDGGACGTLPTITAIGVEAGAGIGAWCFFVGTIMYVHGPLMGAFYDHILWVWICGSIAFTVGSLFLSYRHFIMGL